MANSNKFYTDTIESLFSGKDSIIENAKIIRYDPEKQVCRIWTMTSGQYKDDVPIYFSSLYRNTGIISPPVEGSTSMVIWGPDRQPFLLPIQITTPYVSVNSAITELNASPAIIDHLLTLRNVQGGEQLIRSLGGAYVFLKNLGDVEIGTNRLHRLSIREKDGTLDIEVERFNWDVSCGRFYFGPTSMDSNDDLRTHYYFELEEFADETVKINIESDKDLLNAILDNQFDLIEINDRPKIYKSQKGHVYDTAGYLEYDSYDRTELFQKEEFAKADIQYKKQLSKGGRESITVTSDDREVNIAFNAEEVHIKQKRIENGEWKTSGFKLDPWGNFIVEKDGREYDLLAVLKWFYEERT